MVCKTIIPRFKSGRLLQANPGRFLQLETPRPRGVSCFRTSSKHIQGGSNRNATQHIQGGSNRNATQHIQGGSSD